MRGLLVALGGLAPSITHAGDGFSPVDVRVVGP
jgi:hypothetical protein